MTDTFSWPTQTGNQGTETARVRKAQFGDGYAQKVPDGINALSRSWPFKWSGPKVTALAMRDFLRDHIGLSFFWTAPGDVQLLYTCDSWTINDEGGDGAYTVSATFEQWFSP
jgi:Phage-related protein